MVRTYMYVLLHTNTINHKHSPNWITKCFLCQATATNRSNSQGQGQHKWAFLLTLRGQCCLADYAIITCRQSENCCRRTGSLIGTTTTTKLLWIISCVIGELPSLCCNSALKLNSVQRVCIVRKSSAITSLIRVRDTESRPHSRVIIATVYVTVVCTAG